MQHRPLFHELAKTIAKFHLGTLTLRELTEVSKIRGAGNKRSDFILDLIGGAMGAGTLAFEEWKESWFVNYQVPFPIFTFSSKFSSEPDFVDRFYGFEEITQSIVLPILFKFLRKSTHAINAKSDTLKELHFFEQILGRIKPTSGNSEASVEWYKVLKHALNQFAFEALLEEKGTKSAFEHMETVGVDYIKLTKNAGTSFAEALWFQTSFEVEETAFPYVVLSEVWMDDGDVHEACLQAYYLTVWSIALRYITLVQFYDHQLRDNSKGDFRADIEDRILNLTEEYLDDPEIKENVISLKIPIFVADICVRRKDFVNARKYYAIANITEAEKRKFMARYEINNDLVDELRTLQLLAGC